MTEQKAPLLSKERMPIILGVVVVLIIVLVVAVMVLGGDDDNGDNGDATAEPTAIVEPADAENGEEMETEPEGEGETEEDSE